MMIAIVIMIHMDTLKYTLQLKLFIIRVTAKQLADLDEKLACTNLKDDMMA